MKIISQNSIEYIKTEWEQYDHVLVKVGMKANEAMKILGAGSFGG